MAKSAATKSDPQEGGKRRTRQTAKTAASGAAQGANPELQQLIERMPLWRRPGYLIRRLHQLHYALFFEELAGFDITPVQYGLLTILSTTPDCDQITIANNLGIDRTNVADVLIRLAQAGLVERTRSQVDRRSVLARLTPAGEALLKRAHPAMARAQERLLDSLSVKEKDAFMDTLNKLLEANNKYGRAALSGRRLAD